MKFINLEDIKKTESLKLKALKLATLAHDGKYRKNTNVPYITHPIEVAHILEKVKANRYLIAASYLHDVVEESDFTLDFIEELFGYRVRQIVEFVKEDIDDKTKKDLDWEERKQKAIDKIRRLNNNEFPEIDEDVKKDIIMLSIADRLANITNINNYFKKIGYQDFSAFRRGSEQQEWYYRNVYFALAMGDNDDEITSLLTEFEDKINQVFGRTMEEYQELINENKKIKKLTISE